MWHYGATVHAALAHGWFTSGLPRAAITHPESLKNKSSRSTRLLLFFSRLKYVFLGLFIRSYKNENKSKSQK